MADTRPLPRIRDSASPDPWANLRTSSDPGENQAQRRSPSAVGGRLALIRCNGNLRSADNCSIPLRLGLLLTLSSAVLPSAPYFRSISSVAGAWVPAFVWVPASRLRVAGAWVPAFVERTAPGRPTSLANRHVSPELGFRPSLSADRRVRQDGHRRQRSVAGAWVPAFVERHRVQHRRSQRRSACRRSLGSGLR